MANPLQAAPTEAEPTAAASPTARSAVFLEVPIGTLVALRIDQNLSSQTSKRGDTFSISLMNDLRIGDHIVVPAGTKGVGEVIHAAGKGFGGRAGELIVTARYLEVNQQRIALKNFKLGVAGADQTEAALIAGALVPFAGMFVTGTSATIGVGQLAQAKLAEAYHPPATNISNPPAALVVEIKEQNQ